MSCEIVFIEDHRKPRYKVGEIVSIRHLNSLNCFDETYQIISINELELGKFSYKLSTLGLESNFAIEYKEERICKKGSKESLDDVVNLATRR